MAVTKYSYVKAVNILQLEQEIANSSIVHAVDHIDLNGTALDVYMKDAISAGDKTILDGLITDHVIDTTVAEDQTDSDGAIIVRPKAAKKGFTYHKHHMQFTTSKANSLVEEDHKGNALNHTVLSFFKLVAGELESCAEGVAEFTQIDFMPDYDYEIIGGEIQVFIKPSVDVRVWVIAVPDVPAANGGSKVMVDNCNLKYYSPDLPVNADGRVSKFMSYNATYKTNKLRFYFKHHAGVQQELQCLVEMFKA